MIVSSFLEYNPGYLVTFFSFFFRIDKVAKQPDCLTIGSRVLVKLVWNHPVVKVLTHSHRRGGDREIPRLHIYYHSNDSVMDVPVTLF